MLIKTKVRKGSGRFFAFGVWWEANVEEASMHLDCIKAGGKWVNKTTGEMAGEGLYFHFRRFQEIVWPEKIWEKGPYKNHWAEKILQCYLDSTYLGILGCAASGKSDSLAATVLTDWYPFPGCTTILVSSTELMMLERRIWGFIKKYHKLAKQRYPWLPGHLIEGKQMIIQDAREQFSEGRQYINGLMGCACKKGNQFVGLGCFPSGALVDTQFGPRRIETIAPGDLVWSAAGLNSVRKCSTRIADTLIRVRLSDGRQIDCTPNHPFFTSSGWVNSACLGQEHYILSPHETLLILQEANAGVSSKQKVLQRGLRVGELQEGVSVVQDLIYSFRRQKYFLWKILFDEVENVGQGFCGSHHCEQRPGSHWQSGERMEKSESGSLQKTCEAEPFTSRTRTVSPFAPHLDYSQEEWREGFQWQRQWLSTNPTGSDSDSSFPGSEMEHANPGRNSPQRKGWLALGKSRPWLVGFETGCGSGRRLSLAPGISGTRHETGQAAKGAWVESVEILKRCGDERYDEGEGGYRVHNLEVAGHPSYCVNGLVSHNSFIGIHNERVRLVADEAQLMTRAFLDGTANLSKCPDFKLVAPGNPNETTNTHGAICEPAVELGGWDGGIDQTPGTKTWKTRFPNGLALQLPGGDSPNLQAPENEEVPFPFLITRKQMDDDAAIWSRSDWHFDMFINAKMPRGQGTHRVITRQECEKNGATLEPFWRDSNIIKIGSLDAAYRSSGGDRCVFTEINFGMESESDVKLTGEGALAQKSNAPKGRQIMALVDQIIIPIEGGPTADTPEAQIVAATKTQCENRGIAPSNFWFDSGLRTSLVQEFSRSWSLEVNSVDCGDTPTDQRVSMEIDLPCKDYYKKLVTELWFSIRLVIISKQFRNLSKDLMWELCAREWKNSPGNKIEVENKVEMKEKTGRSPDLGDSLSLAVFGARQRGFQIARLLPPEQQRPNRDDWKSKLRARARALCTSGQLEFASS